MHPTSIKKLFLSVALCAIGLAACDDGNSGGAGGVGGAAGAGQPLPLKMTQSPLPLVFSTMSFVTLQVIPLVLVLTVTKPLLKVW